jgi:hypothetical protein
LRGTANTGRTGFKCIVGRKAVAAGNNDCKTDTLVAGAGTGAIKGGVDAGVSWEDLSKTWLPAEADWFDPETGGRGVATCGMGGRCGCRSASRGGVGGLVGGVSVLVGGVGGGAKAGGAAGGGGDVGFVENRGGV